MSVKLAGNPHGTISEASELVETTQSAIRVWVREGRVRAFRVGKTLLVNLKDVERRKAMIGRHRGRPPAYNRSLWLRVSTATHEAVARCAADARMSQQDYLRMAVERMVTNYRGRNEIVLRAYSRGFADGQAACVRAVEEVYKCDG